MFISYEYYNVKKEDLDKKEIELIDEIVKACKMQFPMSRGRINQRTINSWVRRALKECDWKSEYMCPHGDDERFDFFKESEQKNYYIEVEYENRFSVDHDLLKFMKTYQVQDNSFFILVVPKKDLAVGKSIASFEYANNLMEKCNFISVPLIIMGVGKDNEYDILDVDRFNYTNEEYENHMKKIRNSKSPICFTR